MDKDNIEQVIFVEVKSGKGKSLNRREKTLKDAIEGKRVKWEKYEIPEDVIKIR
jgi:predicted Holliday junction resolvase-like endonuclease